MSNLRLLINLAGDLSIPPEYLVALSNDDDPIVQAAVASNSSLPLERIRMLSHSPFTRVRLGIAKNPKVIDTILRNLSTDNDGDVQLEVAKHPNTPIDALNVLKKSKFSDVRAEADRQSKLRAKDEREQVSDTDFTMEFSLKVSDVEDQIRENTKRRLNDLNRAQDPNTDAGTLSVLSLSNSELVRLAVAKHPNTALLILEGLELDSSLAVCDAAKHSYATKAIAASREYIKMNVSYLIQETQGETFAFIAKTEVVDPARLEHPVNMKLGDGRISFYKSFNDLLQHEYDPTKKHIVSAIRIFMDAECPPTAR